MKASRTTQVGNIGEALATLEFLKIDWHVAQNPAGEVGSDLLLQARTADLMDHGALVGAQVKYGPSFFDEPETDDDGNIVGWWFRDADSEHVKYWLDYAVPFILLLCDETTKKLYWVHVTQDAVVSTGKGSKILVPAHSTVDADHAAELLEVATEGRISSQWEGSAWGGVKVLAADRLRYAMLAPRLVAPHPNLEVAELSSEEAVALLVKMRLHDLVPQPESRRKTSLENSPAPDLEQCRKSNKWGWRFYAALHDVLLGDDRAIPSQDVDSDPLKQIIEEATEPHDRAAAAVCACALLVEEANPEGGLRVIESALSSTEYRPIDQAWLILHKARCLAELGDLEGARLLALDVQKVRASAVDDPTAMAITGSGADLIFRLDPWASDIGELIKGRDTLASWWRNQEVAAGLQSNFDSLFQQWVGESKSTEFDSTFLRLRAAALLAGLAADHSSWQHSHKLLAQHVLTSYRSQDDLAESLSALRHASEEKVVAQVARHLLRVGPAEAVRAAVGKGKLDRATRTSLHADLQLVSTASDVLEPAQADEHVRWILSNLSDLGGLASRLQPSFSLEYVLLDTLENLAPVVSADALREVIEYIKDLPEQSDIGSAHDWAAVINNIPTTAWTDDDRAALAARNEDSSEVKEAIDRVLAEGDPTHRERIREKLRDGNVLALDAFGDVRDLDADTVKTVIDKLVSGIEQQILDLTNGNLNIGGSDFAATLILLNAWHPEVAVWEPISELFTTPSPFRAHLTKSLKGLRGHSKRIPTEVVDRLVPPLHDLMVTPPSTHPFFRNEDVRGRAASALAALRPAAISDEELWDLLQGNAHQRAAAVEVVVGKGLSGRYDTLVAMSRDRDPWVRAVIANQIARTTPEDGDAIRLKLISRLLSNEGTLVAQMVANIINSSPPDVETDQAVGMLRENVSADVRRAIAEYDAKREL